MGIRSASRQSRRPSGASRMRWPAKRADSGDRLKYLEDAVHAIRQRIRIIVPDAYEDQIRSLTAERDLHSAAAAHWQSKAKRLEARIKSWGFLPDDEHQALTKELEEKERALSIVEDHDPDLAEDAVRAAKQLQAEEDDS